MLVLGSQSKFLDVDLSVSVGNTLSAFPSGKRVQLHANICTPGAES